MRSFTTNLEIGSGVPSSDGKAQPAFYLDADSAILYYRVPGSAWSTVDAAIDGMDATAGELNAVADLSAFAVAVTATADGTGTGTIAERGVMQYVTVTSANADHIVVLPAPTPGRMVWLNVATNGFELRSSAPATVAINGGTAAAAESAIAANSTILAICISATAWKAIFLDADSDVAKVEAAA